MHPRIEIVRKIDDIKDHICSPCGTKDDRYCIDQCEHGKQLRSLGEQLTNLVNQKRLNKQKPIEVKKVPQEKPKETIKIKWYQEKLRSDVNVSEKLTKEKYLELKDQKLTDTQIIKQFYLNNVTFYKMKKDWGLKGVKNNKVESLVTVESSPELGNENEQLKKVVEEKQFALNATIGASEKLIEENEQLKKEIEELKVQLEVANSKPAPVTSFYYELEEQNNALRKCLKMVL